VCFEAVREVRRGLPTLGDAICAARYRVEVGDAIELAPCLEAFRGRGPVTVRRERAGKVRTFELDRELLALEPADGTTVRMTLAVRTSGPFVRPEEALKAIFGEPSKRFGLVREDLLVAWKGHLLNPLLAAAASHVGRAVR
jgi:hypothetical protein